MLLAEQELRGAQLALLRVMAFVLVKGTARQRKTTMIRSLRDQMGQLVDSTQRTPVSLFAFVSYVLNAKFVAWEACDDEITLGNQLGWLLLRLILQR